MNELEQPVRPARRWRRGPHELVIDRAPTSPEAQRRLERERYRFAVGMVDPTEFAQQLGAEFGRHQRGGADCIVASISLFEMHGLSDRVGAGTIFDLVTDVTDVVARHLEPNDLVNVSEDGEILLMARGSKIQSAIRHVDRVCRAIAGTSFVVNDERTWLTPSAGVATLADGLDAADVIRRAVDAREVAAGHLDLRVHRWEPAMSADTARAARAPFARFGWQAAKERLRTPSQILATYVAGLVIPFLVYWSFDNLIGFDISFYVYVFCVLTLVSTGAMILVEASLAVQQREPPEVDEYPEATAIICAYLPNEAGTIVETLDCFLNLGYPGGLQVILAYNTPTPMAIEDDLHRLADARPDLDVVRVEGSTSKAQNVNAALSMARGALTGMFDADHMPRRGSFERAWRWLAHGYDIVQGHCLTRNGHETWLAKMIAVEFESIYAVAHPGRAKLHRFGVFGGSNGYWKTGLLHETRMRGSMLTEDIDSSMRTVERGLKIRSDRDVVSRELGTTTFRQVWNQRLRWAQGWFQVTMMHTVRVWRSQGLTARQKFGATYLLGWREVYPWLSLQVFPLLAFWLARGDALTHGWPIFFCSTIFVLHVGPVQTLYAYRLADHEIKRHTRWFWAYLFFSTLFYTEYKNTIARVAHIKEIVGERAWKVTPRTTTPAETGAAAPDAVADGDDHDHEHDRDHDHDRDSVGAEHLEPAADGSSTASAPEGLSELPRDPGSDRVLERVDRARPSGEPAGLPRAADGRAVPVGSSVSDVESEHLLRSLARHDHVDGLPGRPMLPRRSRGAHLHREHRTSEELIAHRVRRLTNPSPSTDRANTANRPLPRSVDRAPGRPMSSAPVVDDPTITPVEVSGGSVPPSACIVFDGGWLPPSPDHVDAAPDRVSAGGRSPADVEASR